MIGNFWEALITASPLAMVCCDLAGKVIIWNPAASELFGWTEEEVLGRPYPLLSEDEFQENMSDILAGKTQTSEVIRKTKDGRRVALSISNAPLRDENGVVSGTFAIFVNISDRKDARAEQQRLHMMLMRQTIELAAANERLQKLDELKAEFLATVSHELRTPLVTIQAVSDTIKLTAPPESLRFFEIMDRNIQRLSRMIGNLLNRSRLDAGQFLIRKETIDLRPLIMQTVENFLPLAQKAKVRLEVKLPEDPIIVSADPDAMVQIAANLIDNAVRFAESSVVVTSDGAALIVENDGTSVSPEDMTRLFDRFSKVRTREGKSQMGLGLSVVKALVDLHGGKITAECRASGGMRFTVSGL